jgi:type I restriction enzyme M protein
MSETKKEVNFEQTLFKAADKLRKNIDAAEYKHVALGLLFLKYISESFEELHGKLLKGEGDYEGADPEDYDEYTAENVFFVPEKARWSYIKTRAKLPTVGADLDEAMEEVEKMNKDLKGVLPKVYSRENLDKAALGGLVDLISDIDSRAEGESSKDLLGRIYEYFLGEFANAEGKKGGQFYTPKSIVGLMVQMIEPYKGRVYDPACGSGGMFVMSEKFVEEHKGKKGDISIFGQESNQTTYRLCKMNLAIRGLDASHIAWNTEGSFLKDEHKDLKADFILANPPFNDSDWSGELLRDDARWKYGLPPSGNANFAWLEHMIYHLAPHGVMACVLANGSLSSNISNEGEIRKNLIEADLIDCIVSLPKQLFYNTGIPACIWFISRKRSGNGDRKREGEILFIDASELGYLEDRTHKKFTDEDMAKIAGTYHNWRSKEAVIPATSVIPAEAGIQSHSYEDIKGFCKSANIEEVRKHKHILTPGRYVGIPDEEDDGIPFTDKMNVLTAELKAQMEKEEEMNENIKEQLKKVGFEI